MVITDFSEAQPYLFWIWSWKRSRFNLFRDCFKDIHFCFHFQVIVNSTKERIRKDIDSQKVLQKLNYVMSTMNLT